MRKGLVVEKSEELEKAHLEYLLDSRSARWLLKRMLARSGALRYQPYSGGGVEAYNKGMSDLMMNEVIQPVVKYFGYSALDKIMKDEV